MDTQFSLPYDVVQIAFGEGWRWGRRGEGMEKEEEGESKGVSHLEAVSLFRNHPCIPRLYGIMHVEDTTESMEVSMPILELCHMYAASVILHCCRLYLA